MSIQVRNIRYAYNEGLPDETVAIDDVSFDLFDGEIVGIIGHTGSGKSTMLQQLNGLLRPTEGTIVVDGKEITSPTAVLRDVRRSVGLVFQYPEYQLFEETVSKDVAFGPRNVGLSEEEIDVRVKAAIQLVGLNYDEICDSSPFELSGGQKRRVAIAGVIAMKPSVLILDEPTAGLDPAAHREILSMIKVIHDSLGIIIIFVSHNMADIANLSDRVVVMDKARIAMQGTPQEVFSHEKELTAMGLDVPPMRSIMRKITDAIPSIHSSALTVEEAAHDIRAVIPAPAHK